MNVRETVKIQTTKILILRKTLLPYGTLLLFLLTKFQSSFTPVYHNYYINVRYFTSSVILCMSGFIFVKIVLVLQV